jgi:hypothetical protein
VVNKKVWDGGANHYVKAFIENTKDIVAGYTYHEYIGVDSPETALDPAVLERSRENGMRMFFAWLVCHSTVDEARDSYVRTFQFYMSPDVLDHGGTTVETPGAFG